MKKLFTVVFSLFISLSAFSAVPEFSGWVVDEADVIDDETEATIKKLLTKLDTTTGNQIAVLTINSLNGATIEQYSLNVAEAWKPGQKDKDNGVLFVIAIEDRISRIEVGYGLNPVLTATKTGLIQNKIMNPHFRTGNYGKGILNGVIAAIREVSPEFDFENLDEGVQVLETNGYQVAASLLSFVFVILIFIIFAKTLGRHRGFRKYVFWKSVLGDNSSFGDVWLANKFLGDGKGFFNDDDDDDGPRYLGGGFHGGGGGHFGGGGSSSRW